MFVGGAGRATLDAMVRGKGMFASPNLKDLEEVARRIAAGAVRPYVGQTSPLEEGLEAVRRFARGDGGGKLVLTRAAPS